MSQNIEPRLLTEEAAAELERGEMNRRVVALEGETGEGRAYRGVTGDFSVGVSQLPRWRGGRRLDLRLRGSNSGAGQGAVTLRLGLRSRANHQI